MKIKGTKAPDTLIGGDKGEVISGGRGADELVGNGGLDILKGGKGRDTFFVSPDDLDVIVDFKSGRDKIVIDAGLYDHIQPFPADQPFGTIVDYRGSLLYYNGEPLTVVGPDIPVSRYDIFFH